MDEDRERLKAAIDARAVELRLRLKQVARRAEMSDANLFRIRTGEIAVTPFAAAAIEEALQWEAGSIRALLEGRDATPRSREHAPPMPEDVRIDPADWAAMLPEHREQVVRILRSAHQRRDQQRRGAS